MGMNVATDSWVVFRLSALGDVVLTTGVLDYWHRRRGWRFTVVTRKAWVGVFEGHPAIDGVVGLENADLALPRLLRIYLESAVRHAGKGLLDLHGTLRSRLLAMLWRGPVRRYPKLPVARRLFLRSGGRLCGDTLRRWNVTQRYALAVESEAPARSALLPRIYLTDAEVSAGARFASQVPGQGPLVALHPYATHPDKAWIPDSWTKLAAALRERGVRCCVIGQGTPSSLGPDMVDFTGKTSLRESCALLAAADVLVTGDSGPMHLAGAVGTPVVALFGPTTREWGFFPEGPHDVVLEPDMPCRPCSLHGSRRCRETEGCMARLSPETVVAAVMGVLGRDAADDVAAVAKGAAGR